MSNVVPHRSRLNARENRLVYRFRPRAIEFSSTTQPKVHFGNKTKLRATCLACVDSPCMYLKQADLSPTSHNLRTFPGDPSRDVCPTNAMSWDQFADAPVIDANECIGCGLCAVSCPYGAITLLPEGIAQVNKEDPDGITKSSSKKHLSHMTLERFGSLGSSDSPFVRNLPVITSELGDNQRSRMTRNMLIACGINASIRRKGDTNIRMDGILYLNLGVVGVFELETGGAVLESPRALLEDIAVLHGRFNIPIDEIVPLSIVTELPNRRTEYYRVIDDISKVLHIDIQTFSLGVLCLLMWRFKTLPELKSENYFKTTADAAFDLGKSLEKFDPGFPSEEPYQGAFRPAK